LHNLALMSISMTLAGALVSCGNGGGTNGGGSGEDDDAILVSELSAEAVADVTTVVRVRFTTSEPVRARVEFGDDELRDHTTGWTEAGTSHELLLLGMTPDGEVSYQVVLELSSGEQREAPGTAHTGSLPSSFPRSDLTVDTEPIDGWILTTLAGNASGPVIYDGRGQLVWYHVEDRGFNTYRARLARDGKAVLYNAVAIGLPEEVGGSRVVRVGLDGVIEAEYEIALATHDFVELPGGNIVSIAYDVREHDGEELRGDRLAFHNVHTGGSSTVWSTWDSFDPDLVGYDDGDDTWTHANALDYHESEDAFYVSMRDLGSIVKIDALTGELLWGISGQANDFSFIDDETEGWEYQHQFELVGDQLTVFDNGDSDRASSYIRTYTLDTEAMTAELTWLHESVPPHYVWALGDVDTLEGGDVLVSWATLGLLQRIDPEGEVVWELTSPLGSACGYVTVEDSLYKD